MLTPHDLDGKTFSKALNGYNRTEVDDFITQISEQLEIVMRDSDYLKTQLTDADKKLANYLSQEDSLKDALLVAQITSNDLKKRADEDAKKTLAKAEVEANSILASAEKESSDILARARRDADKNLNQAKEDYKEIQLATSELKKDYMAFKEKYQQVLKEQIRILEQIDHKDELTE